MPNTGHGQRDPRQIAPLRGQKRRRAKRRADAGRPDRAEQQPDRELARQPDDANPPKRRSAQSETGPPAAASRACHDGATSTTPSTIITHGGGDAEHAGIDAEPESRQRQQQAESS